MIARILLLAACSFILLGCQAGPEGPVGPQGPEGPVGPQGPAGGADAAGGSYSSEMYDDCRDAFGQLSIAVLRALIADSREFATLPDDDVRAMMRVICFTLAAGERSPFQDFWDGLEGETFPFGNEA